MSIEKIASLIGVGVVTVLLCIAIFSREDRSQDGLDQRGTRVAVDEAGGGRLLDLDEDRDGSLRSWTLDAEGHVAPKPKPRPKPRQDGRRTVTVRRGDNLWTLAKRELGRGALWKRIAALNPGLDPEHLQQGTVVVLPESENRITNGRANSASDSGKWPVRHVVRRGETPSSIAKRYYGKSTEWKPILAANGLRRPRDLRRGATIVVPAPPRK
ncbi:MAG TPA: LysM domain-containing protein [Planctomycetes bacterium]|nr:LysM domain-containing protein [Planctomycetota bacterium]